MVIELKNVSKIIKEKNILIDISKRFESGKIYILKGHNGSGKTMLLRMLCGLIKPTNGEVVIEGNPKFGVIIENPAFLENETVLYNLNFLAKIRNEIKEETILEYLKKFNLYNERNSKVKSLSLGMKQRLAIIQALMENQNVLLFDEPFNALDKENQDVLLDTLSYEKNKGSLIVIATHYLDEKIEGMLDEVISLNNGRII